MARPSIPLAFANRPEVNLGVAIAALGGALVLSHFTKAEDKDYTAQHAGEWLPPAKRHSPHPLQTAAIYGLVAAAGIAGYRAAALPNKFGESYLRNLGWADGLIFADVAAWSLI